MACRPVRCDMMTGETFREILVGLESFQRQATLCAKKPGIAKFAEQGSERCHRSEREGDHVH
ncbi:hypothetical protein GCM10023155_36110 [Bremerella cremea]